MLFYYVCTIGEKLHKDAFPQGAQSKDADVHKLVTMHSGSPAVCQRQHSGTHEWRPDDGGEEERVVRGYAVLQWDKAGFPEGTNVPRVGDRFGSAWGPALVLERVDDPITGAYLLLRLFPHGYHGKPGELSTQRTDAPKEFAGRV